MADVLTRELARNPCQHNRVRSTPRLHFRRSPRATTTSPPLRRLQPQSPDQVSVAHAKHVQKFADLLLLLAAFTNDQPSGGGEDLRAGGDAIGVIGEDVCRKFRPDPADARLGVVNAVILPSASTTTDPETAGTSFGDRRNR
jgi:hypothetical protein